jgi:membrane protein DedA with SNARE-associated domain
MNQFWIAVLAALSWQGGLGGLYYLIIKQIAVIGAKTIQFLSIVFVLPLLLALGVTGVLRARRSGRLSA